MSLNVPNLDRLTKIEPKLGEALKKIQDYTNSAISNVPGNFVAPPTFVTPSQRPG